MSIEFLPWDSDFFGIKIGKVLVNQPNMIFENIIKKAHDENYKLLYCYVEPQNVFHNEKLSQYGTLVDRKVTFHRRIENKNFTLPSGVEQFFDTSVSNDIYGLIIQSGEYSRFKIDKRFPPKSFERLYFTWLENSLNKTFADAVYVYKHENTIKGLLILKDNNKSGTISIISVDKNARGQKIGTKLIEATYFHYSQKNIYEIEVVTQFDNQQACKFYEANGFTIKSVVNIYHLWI